MAARKARKLSSYEPMAPHGSVKEHDVMQSCYRPRGRLNRSGQLNASGQKVAKTEPLTPRPGKVQEAQNSIDLDSWEGTTEHYLSTVLDVPKAGERGRKIVNQIVGFSVMGCVILAFLLLTGPKP